MANNLKTVLLLGLLSGLVLAIGALVAPDQLHVFAGMALVMNLGAWFFSDRLVLRMSHAVEVSPAEAPELHGLVAELAASARIPKPRVYVMREAQPNAFATGRNPTHGVVAVTEGLLGMLDRRELRGVLAHELAHIRNRDILVSSIAAAAATTITYLAQALSFGAMFGRHDRDEHSGSGAGALLAIVVAPLAATLIQLGISRSREFVADESGAAIAGDAEGLARALRKLEAAAGRVPAEVAPATASLFIVNPFGATRQMARLFSTHPSTEERVARLMAIAARGGVRRSL
jgi:heat shock protein HtpX